MSKVTYRFKKGGKSTTKVEGVPGEACREASRPGETAIGGRIVSDTPTPEMTEGAGGIAVDAGQSVGN